MIYWLSRLYHHLYAIWHAYFWLPCPVCGRNFGGHEMPRGSLMITHSTSEATCPRCVDAPEVHAAHKRLGYTSRRALP